MTKLTSPIFILVTALAAAMLASGSYAADPEDQKDYQEISAPEVKEMLDQKKGTVIHVLSEIEFEMQHITGSINIPITAMKTTNRLPADKSVPIVFYCMGKR